MRYTKKEEVKKENENKFNLQECVILWLNRSKGGVKYLSGFDLNKNRVLGYFNKKNNDNQPSVRVYSINEDGSRGEEIITLWDTESKKGTKMLSGLTNENEKLIGFYGDELKEMRPYIKVYFKEN